MMSEDKVDYDINNVNQMEQINKILDEVTADPIVESGDINELKFHHHHHHHHSSDKHDHHGKNHKSKHGKKMPTWLNALIIIVVILTIVIGGGFLYLKSKLSKIKRLNEADNTRISRDQETFETDATAGDTSKDTISPDEITWNFDTDIMRDADIKNILLIGQDRRPGEERARSDSMIICSINKKTNKIVMASLMRDMYVPLPGFSDNRINAAYAFGGMDLLDETIEQDFGIHIDSNVEVDFDGFVSVMAEIGPIDIDIQSYEVDYMNDKAHEVNQGWNIHEGINSLTPDQALAYARMRYAGNSDWERTDRQRKVLRAAFENVKDLSLTELLQLTDKVFPYFTTDMTDSEIMGYVYTVYTNKMSLGTDYRLPVEGTYSSQTIYGMSVLVPDLQKNAEELKKYIYGHN